MVGLVSSTQSGKSQVGYPRAKAVVQENVARFDVVVNGVLGVDGCHAQHILSRMRSARFGSREGRAGS